MGVDGEVVYQVRADGSQLESDLNQAENTTKKSAGKLAGIAKGAGTAIVAGVGAAAAIGTMAVKTANDLDKAMNGFSAATGKQAGELEKYQSVLEGVYKNNYGESFEDIADQMSKMSTQGMFEDMGTEEIQKAIESGYALCDVYKIDMEQSTNGASAMMKQFGISAEDAYNLMAQGAEQGLNQNGDLADQLAEYSTYYADLGYSAEDMFNIIKKGAEDGTFQIDYLNDAMKEFGIRSKDNSDASREAFEKLGLDADKMTKAFGAGGDESKKAFAEVANALKNTDDLVKQNELGVALFGTKWEDLGADAILAMTETSGAIDLTKNKMEEMKEVKYSSISDMFGGLTRAVEMLLIPLGEMLIPVLKDVIEEIMPIIEELLPVAVGLIQMLLPIITSIISAILPPLVSFLGLIFEKLTPIIEKIMPVITQVLQAIVPILFDILSAILPPLLDVLLALLEPITELILTVLPPLASLLLAIAPLFQALVPIIQLVAQIMKESLGNAIDGIVPIISNLMGYLQGLIDFITAVFTGDWEKAWEAVQSIFKNIFEAFVGIVKLPLNLIIGLINNMISGLNGLKIPDWVPGLGGKSIDLPTIPKLRVGMDYVPNDDFPALLHKGEAVLTAGEAELYRGIGGKGSLGRLSVNPASNYSSADNSVSESSYTYNIYTQASSAKDAQELSEELARLTAQEEKARGR